jgi:predicted HAD superfamily Cof-like phosphohydrolase
LIVEELFELAVASDSVEEFNLVMQEYERRSYSASSYPMDNNIRVLESLDALCDLQYVTSGGIVDFGFNEIFREAFEEVHRSNMSKMCINEEEALRTVEYYKQKGTESYVKKVDRYWVVYRIADDKVLKSIHYSPANLERVLISYKVRKKL